MTDWTDYRRSNPEMEATRDRWNARFCRATEMNPEPSLRPWFLAAVCVLIFAGMCLLASVA